MYRISQAEVMPSNNLEGVLLLITKDAIKIFRIEIPTTNPVNFIN